jgi:hypothetical protein
MINLKLNGTKIPIPENDIQIDEIEISRAERTVSGRLVKDIIAIKKTFTLSYAGLLPADALTFINAYRIGEPVTFEYEDVEGSHSKQVYIHSLPRSIYNPKPQYTKNITVVLEEV